MKRSPLPGPPLDRLPDHVKLGIRSVVGDKVVATGEPEPDATYTVCVGQVGQHLATSNARILAVQWAHSGGGPVAGYTATPNAGIIMPVTPQMLGGNPLTFAWSIGGPAVVGVYIYTEYGIGYASNNFEVTAPQVNFLDSRMSQVCVGTQSDGTFLSLGNRRPGHPGIIINAVTFGTQNVAGVLGIIQLADNQRFGTDTNNRPWHGSLNGQTVLDVGQTGSVIYQNEIAALNPGGNAQLDVTDSPALQLGPPFKLVAVGDGEPVVPETYKSYLMFQPDGGIWVPLSVLTWSWAGYSELKNNVWGPPQDPQPDPQNAVNPLGVATHTFPTWNANTTGAQWAAGLT